MSTSGKKKIPGLDAEGSKTEAVEPEQQNAPAPSIAPVANHVFFLDTDLAHKLQIVVNEWYPLAEKAVEFFEAEEKSASYSAKSFLGRVVDRIYEAGLSNDVEHAHLQLAGIAGEFRSAVETCYMSAVGRRIERLASARRLTVGRLGMCRRMLGATRPRQTDVDQQEDVIASHLEFARAGFSTAAPTAGAITKAVADAKFAYEQIRALERLYNEHARIKDWRLNLAAGLMFCMVSIIGGYLLGLYLPDGLPFLPVPSRLQLPAPSPLLTPIPAPATSLGYLLGSAIAHLT